MYIVMYDEEYDIIGYGAYQEISDIPDGIDYVEIGLEDLKYELTIIDGEFGDKTVERGSLKSLVKVLSKYQFRARFTVEEKIAIENYDISSSLTSEQKTVLRVMLKDLEMSDVIELNSPAISAGLDILISYGLIEPGRKAEILEIKGTP